MRGFLAFLIMMGLAAGASAYTVLVDGAPVSGGAATDISGLSATQTAHTVSIAALIDFDKTALLADGSRTATNLPIAGATLSDVFDVNSQIITNANTTWYSVSWTGAVTYAVRQWREFLPASNRVFRVEVVYTNGINTGSTNYLPLNPVF